MKISLDGAPLRRIDAFKLYMALNGLVGLFTMTIFTVNQVYFVLTVGLNPLQLVLVGTVVEATVLLFEVPTGVVADLYGRRLSVIIGFALIGAAFVLEGSVPVFSAILLAQVVWGLGATFTSGAQEAWIADEVGERRAAGAFLRGFQMHRIGSLGGIAASVALASIHLQLPIVVGGGLLIGLAIFLALTMPETGFARAPESQRETWRSMRATFAGGFRTVSRTPVLITVFIAVGLYAAMGEGLDRLSTAHFLQTFDLPSLGTFQPVVWFGIISAVSIPLSLLAAEIARRRLDTNDSRAVTRALFGVNVLLFGGVLIFGAAGNFALALAAFWAVRPLRDVIDPVMTAWANHHIPRSVRATVFSMRGQADALGQVVGGPTIGAVGTILSLRAAILTAAGYLVPVSVLYAIASRRWFDQIDSGT